MGGDPRFTRRSVLASAALGVGALGARTAAAHAARSTGRAALVNVPVGALAPGTPLTLAPRGPFELAAVRWTGPARPHVELRARRCDGSWGPWALASAAGHEGDGVRGEGRVGEGIWTGRSRRLQLRTGARVTGVSVQLVDASALLGSTATGASAPPVPAAAGRALESGGPAATASALPHASPILAAGPGQPPIIARSAWAGPRQQPAHGPLYGTVELAFVHHTDSPDGYGPEAVPAMLRSIWAFHVYGRGWWDIGYNFLIDRFGRIWEGRAGGIDLPVQGAQAGDWNEISTGVAMLGTYAAAEPAPAALSALAHLLAWKLSLHGRPTHGEIEAVVQPADVSYTQFRAGERIQLPRIAGHRQADATECPGDVLYGRLPDVRASAARLAGVTATLSASAELAEVALAGPSLTLGGRLARGAGGAPIGGAPIAIERVVGRAGRTRTIATATTAADGRWQATLTGGAVRSLEGGIVRALYAGAPAVVSDVVDLGRI